MRKLLLVAVVYSTALMSVKSVDKPFQSFDAIINVGGDCQVAYQLSKNGLRKYALPFDAFVTPYESLKEMLQNFFEGFMAQDNFEFVVSEKEGNYILDKRYGIHLLHDFKMQEDFLKDYQEISEKYLRRIDRLIELITTTEYPVFIRKMLTKEQALELSALLSVMRKGKPFLLVVVDDTEEIKSDWQLEGVRNYYLRQLQPYSWKGDSGAWQEIFSALNLETGKSIAKKEHVHQNTEKGITESAIEKVEENPVQKAYEQEEA